MTTTASRGRWCRRQARSRSTRRRPWISPNPPPPPGPGPSDDPTIRAKAAPAGAEVIRLAAEAGVAFPFLNSSRQVQGSALFAGRVGGEYEVRLPKLDLDFGAAATFSPLSFHVDKPGATPSEQRSNLIGVFATGGVRVPITDDLSFGATLGLGVVWWTGLVTGNPFTEDGVGATGAIPMLLRG